MGTPKFAVSWRKMRVAWVASLTLQLVSEMRGGLVGTEEGTHRAWPPSQACLCCSCAATSPVDSELCA